ncbi:MAG: hypothetical protein CMI23_09440 [Opitutae bacterium]|jgi:hypothetical protein|nr:hypothetical protein [Opitutae bacterium]|tara:strand:- start:411 stop:791 length:381 start_codon:yes stop_codon:yes gene_type:complete
MSFSNYLEDAVLNHVFGGSSYTAPTTLYVALFTSAPSDTGGGTEVSGGAYARQTGAFTVSSGTASNSSAIEYPTATADYGTVVAMGIFDASSGGNLLAYGSLTTSKNVSTGDVLRFNASAIDITLN